MSSPKRDGQRRFTRDEALEIRRLYQQGTGFTTLCSRFSASPAAVLKVLNGTHPSIRSDNLPNLSRGGAAKKWTFR